MCIIRRFTFKGKIGLQKNSFRPDVLLDEGSPTHVIELSSSIKCVVFIITARSRKVLHGFEDGLTISGLFAYELKMLFVQQLIPRLSCQTESTHD